MTLNSMPVIPLLGVNPSHPVIADRSQFTLLHLWYGKFVITHYQHALWVLDPSGSNVIGTLADRLPIIDITCCNDSVYLLRPDKQPIVKLTLHTDFKRFLAPPQSISSSSSDLSSTLDSGSYRLSVEEPVSDHSSKVSAEALPIVTNTTPNSSEKEVSSSQPNLSQDTSQKVSQDLQGGDHIVRKTAAGLTLAGLSLEDRLHKLQSPSPVESPSSIAVQSVLKKKKKKKKRTTSHDVTGQLKILMHLAISVQDSNTHIVHIFHFLSCQ